MQGKTIKVEIKITSVLSRPYGKDKFQLKLKENTTVKQLLEKLGYNKEHLKIISPIVNNHYKKHNYKLKDNDKITLTMIIGGG